MEKIENVLSVLNNEHVAALLAILLTLYGALAQIQLPDFVVTLFKNDVFRVVFLSLLLIFRLDKAPHVALIVALVIAEVQPAELLAVTLYVPEATPVKTPVVLV